MPGSVRVSFAGSYQEAVAYCADKPKVNAPKGLARKGDDSGLPMLSVRYRNSSELSAAQNLLHSLGWEREFQCVHPNGNGF